MSRAKHFLTLLVRRFCLLDALSYQRCFLTQRLYSKRRMLLNKNCPTMLNKPERPCRMTFIKSEMTDNCLQRASRTGHIAQAVSPCQQHTMSTHRMEFSLLGFVTLSLAASTSDHKISYSAINSTGISRCKTPSYSWVLHVS